MQNIFGQNSYTTTPNKKISFWARLFPGTFFYIKFFPIVWRAANLAKKNKYTDGEWIKSSLTTLHVLESVGIKIEIKNLQVLKNLQHPVIFIANHMSTLETFVLPCVIQSFTNVTFVVKKELIDYPLFGHVMRNRNPIVVGRANPRDDFKIVLQEGIDRLKQGISIIIFPQTTRSSTFDPEKFNSIGVKLAKNANVPIIPIALKTDAWGTGKIIKDIGKINPNKKVSIIFGDEINVADNGKKAHEQVVKFIMDKLTTFQ